MLNQILHLAIFNTIVSGHRHGHSHGHGTNHGDTASPFITALNEYVFFFKPRYNALLATFLIQLLPCIVVFVIPGLQNNSGDGVFLKILVSFAVGTLLGDVFLHLIPETFDMTGSNGETNMTMLATVLFIGFMAFLTLDKTLRIASLSSSNTGSTSGLLAHSHSHSTSMFSDSHNEDITMDFSAGKEDASLRSRKKKSKGKNTNNAKSPKLVEKKHQHEENESENMTAYLNVISSFAHNITDGIALATSFYSSGHIGITTTIAVISHEVPHELGDFAILLSSGFSFAQAVKSQLVTSIGALLGTAIGCALNEFTVSGNDVLDEKVTASLFNGFSASQLMLPLTAGGFLYIATVGVVPEILATSGTSKIQGATTFFLQLTATIIGFVLMFQMTD